MNTLRHPRRTIGALLTGAAVTAVTLTGCAPAGPGAASGIDEVQAAVIQLEAHGTFVSPEGAFEGAGRGSGFIIDPTGIAVTNNHVVTGAGTIDVWIGGDDSTSVSAQVLGVSECLDLAVVQLPPGSYPTLEWRTDPISVGTEVYSAGFPLGDPAYTLTKGIVSKADVPQDTNWASVDHVIEHDARIRPGNSGGPLVDAQGRIVGVNYAVNNEFDQNDAIHRDQARPAIESLRDGDLLSLGINGRAIANDDGVGLGIWVESIASGTPADEAGIEPGDLLTRMEGISLGTSGTLREYCDVLETKGTDAVLSVELLRTGENAFYEGRINSGDEVEPRDGVTPTPDPVEGDVLTVTDDTGSVSFQVPAAWAQVDGAPIADASGRPFARLSASPDLAGYSGTWNVPGATAWVTPDAGAGSPDEVADLLASVVADGACGLSDSGAYDDDVHTGSFEVWAGCGGVSAVMIVVFLDARDAGYRAVVALQAATETDVAAIDLVLGSFRAGF